MITSKLKYLKYKRKSLETNSHNNRCPLRIVLLIWLGLPVREKLIAIAKYFNPHF